jgi:hypothetical protein
MVCEPILTERQGTEVATVLAAMRFRFVTSELVQHAAKNVPRFTEVEWFLLFAMDVFTFVRQ